MSHLSLGICIWSEAFIGFSSTWLHGYEELRSMKVGHVISLSAEGRSAKLGSRAYLLIRLFFGPNFRNAHDILARCAHTLIRPHGMFS